VKTPFKLAYFVPPIEPKTNLATDVPSIVAVNVPPSLVLPHDEQYCAVISAEKLYGMPAVKKTSCSKAPLLEGGPGLRFTQ